jgi:TonB-linked SusC/RagA family outer membrane protein
MNKILKFITYTFVLCIINYNYTLPARGAIIKAQNKISGTVTDAQTGETIPGVNIQVVGTTTGTSTNAQGYYSLNVPSMQDTLKFSFIGYETRKIPISGRTTINIKLKPTVFSGKQVVVIGYGTQKKQNITGAVNSIQGTEINSDASISLSNKLSGEIPGLVALNQSGQPGENFSHLLIRGKGTLGDNSPLIVIDGVPGREGLDDIDPRDIKSISVLKGASAAIYGARAANGAIIITTKKGVEGTPKINYSFNYGFLQPTRLPKFANSVEYAKFLNYQNELTGKYPAYTSDEIEKFRTGSDPLAYPDNDWHKDLFKKFSTQNKHHLSFSGGTSKLQYYVSGNYSNSNGILKNGIGRYRVFGGRANINADITDNLSVGVRADLSKQKQIAPAPRLSDRILGSGLRGLPTQLGRYPNGMYGLGLREGGAANPLIEVTNAAGNKTKFNYLTHLVGNFKYSIPHVNGLSINGFISYDQSRTDSTVWKKPFTVYGYDSDTKDYSPIPGGPEKPQLFKRNAFSLHTIENVRLSYKFQAAKHDLKTFIGFEQGLRKTHFLQAFRKDFPTDIIEQLSAGSTADQRLDGSATRFSRRNIIGRIDYAYENKYLINFNIRYDGSTNFAKQRRYGVFPGVSAGWVISSEPFLQKINFINQLKIKASWGEVGNDVVPPFQYLTTYNLTNGAIFGLDKNLSQGLERGVEANPFITWEVAKKIDAGLEAKLWNGLLGLNLDFFKERRTNILVPRSHSVPEFSGLNLPDENIGEVNNKGFELQMTHTNEVSNKFNYSVRGNISYHKDKVIFMDEAPNIPEWQKKEGLPIGSDEFYIATGIYRSQDEIDNTPHKPDTKVNDLILKDVNNDGKITSLDRVRLPKTHIPRITYGANFSFAYGNFDWNVFFRGQAESWMYYWLPQGDFGNALKYMAENIPTKNNPHSKLPNIYSSETEFMQNSFWLYNTSFLRLKKASLGYTLPKNLSNKIGIDNLRIYVNGSNLLTITKFRFGDPSGGTGGNRGEFYPLQKIYNIGFDIKF